MQPCPPFPSTPDALARSVRGHALGWLAGACAVGFGLQLLQLFPALNDGLGPLTYGRWFPVHANAALYGWCAVPLVGLLFHWYGGLTSRAAAKADVSAATSASASDDEITRTRARVGAVFATANGAEAAPEADDGGGGEALWRARLALWGWSAAVAGGIAAWLAGESNGKPFMEWSGWAVPLLPLAMLGLWVVLASELECSVRAGAGERRAWLARGALLAALLPVPFLFQWAARPDVYPAINPDSGGATGTSLLGSTLGAVAIYGAAPYLLGLARVPGRGRWREAVAWGGWLVGMAVLALARQGNASHHERGQQAALGVLLAWAPLAWLLLRTFAWPTAAQRWLGAAFAWWCVLLGSGWLGFLPGWSERFKFTQVLVAHAHLAMAGMVSALSWALLASLGGGRAPGRGGFWGWQAAVALHLGASVWAGVREIAAPGAFFGGEAGAATPWALRLAAGGAMLALAVSWWWRAGTREATGANETSEAGATDAKGAADPEAEGGIFSKA